MLVVLLSRVWIHSSREVGYMLEKFQIIWNCTNIEEKIVNPRKK